jgi:hypothetical protein
MKPPVVGRYRTRGQLLAWFTPPWSVEEFAARIVVKDDAGEKPAMTYNLLGSINSKTELTFGSGTWRPERRLNTAG